ncbi:MAG: TIGR02186 family protein [Pseudomonadota bacterium]
MIRLWLIHRVYSFLIGFILFSFSIPGAYAQNAAIGIDVIQPKTIRIGFFFSGEKVKVRAVVPFGDKVALRLIGPREELTLMKKGRVGGLWMNVEQVRFRNLPKVYLLWTSEKLTSLEAGGGSKTMPLDYLSFLSGTLQSKNREAEPLLLNELIKLKEADGLYWIVEGTVHIKPLEKGVWDQADAVLELPSKIYPGTYALELIAFKEGKGRLLHSSSIVVELVGFPALISSLALQKGLLYGILAVIIATFSGLLIGIVFTSKGGH